MASATNMTICGLNIFIKYIHYYKLKFFILIFDRNTLIINLCFNTFRAERPIDGTQRFCRVKVK